MTNTELIDLLVKKQYMFENEHAKEKISEDEVFQLIDYPKFFEMLKLPLPDNRKGILDRMLQDKIRACYLHACLKYVSGEYMTNQSLRERFKIVEHNYAIISRIIADTIKLGLIKDYDSESKSKKFAKYVPYWF